MFCFAHSRFTTEPQIREKSRCSPCLCGEAPLLFAKWFFAESEDLEEPIRYAADLYTREDHSGTCIPKTLLFAYYKLLQFDAAPAISETARAAIRGELVHSWPDGEIRSGPTWDQMFREYTSQYE